MTTESMATGQNQGLCCPSHPRPVGSEVQEDTLLEPSQAGRVKRKPRLKTFCSESHLSLFLTVWLWGRYLTLSEPQFPHP